MLDDYVLGLFREAAQNEKLWDSVRTYLNLRDVFSGLNMTSNSTTRTSFENLYSGYYGLRAAGLTETWLKQYYELLFCNTNVQLTEFELYEKPLLHLYKYERRQGDKVLQFSFVSKLVAFHDESRPLYDQLVRYCFGFGPPKFGANRFKIAGFVQNLNEIARRYGTWTRQRHFAEILDQMRDRCPRLSDCHDVRLIDFLIHKAEA
jgi:hypothetical protein